MGSNDLTYETDGSVFQYVVLDAGIMITGYHGKKSELYLPETIGGQAVTAIAKKTFFNVSGLYRIFMPDSVYMIGDWAFSHCRDLEAVYLKRKS